MRRSVSRSTTPRCFAALNARTKHSGITARFSGAISYLKRHEGIRQGPLAELIEVEPITLFARSTGWSRRELVERRADPTDRRALGGCIRRRAPALIVGGTCATSPTRCIEEHRRAQRS